MATSDSSGKLALWFDRHKLLVDALGAGFFALVAVPLSSVVFGTGTFGEQQFDSYNSSTGVVSGDSTAVQLIVAIIISIAVIAPLAMRRTRPTLAIVLSYSAALVAMIFGAALVFPGYLALLASLYSAAIYAPRWVHRTGMIGAVVGGAFFSYLVFNGSRSDRLSAVTFTIVIILLFLAAWAFGLVRRSRMERMAALAGRAEQLEREHSSQLQLAAATERARIAREMHDIVAHSLSVVIAQADGGQYIARQDPAAAEQTLRTIAATGRAALADMRRLLGILREPAPNTVPVAAEDSPSSGKITVPTVEQNAPQPSIDDLDQLITHVREAGVPISMVTMGTPRTLPPGTGLNAYRICQEALTNIMKHAGPGVKVTMMQTWNVDSYIIQISDDGRGAAASSDGGGHGIRGMQERAAMFSGVLVAGPRPGGGYRVTLTLPVPTTAEAE